MKKASAKKEIVSQQKRKQIREKEQKTITKNKIAKKIVQHFESLTR